MAKPAPPFDLNAALELFQTERLKATAELEATHDAITSPLRKQIHETQQELMRIEAEVEKVKQQLRSAKTEAMMLREQLDESRTENLRLNALIAKLQRR